MEEEEKKKYIRKDPEYLKKWYQLNKEKHLAYVGQKKPCPLCNKLIANSHMNKHLRTKKHLNNNQ